MTIPWPPYFRVDPNTDVGALSAVQFQSLGIVTSRVAQQKALSETPQYVERDVDEDITKKLQAGYFVVIAGKSKSGKTACALHAIHQGSYAHSLLWAPRAPIQGLINGLSPLNAALELFRPAADRHVVVWLDSLEGHLKAPEGITALIDSVFDKFGDRVRVIATLNIQSPELDAVLWETIQQTYPKYRGVRLPTELSDDEFKRARSLYPGLTTEARSLAAYFIAGPLLFQKFERGVDVQQATVRAAAHAWRLGIQQLATDELFDLTLYELRHTASVADRAEALSWAREPVPEAGTSALILPAGSFPCDSFSVLDYIASHEMIGPLRPDMYRYIQDTFPKRMPELLLTMFQCALREGSYDPASHLLETNNVNELALSGLWQQLAWVQASRRDLEHALKAMLKSAALLGSHLRTHRGDTGVLLLVADRYLQCAALSARDHQDCTTMLAKAAEPLRLLASILNGLPDQGRGWQNLPQMRELELVFRETHRALDLALRHGTHRLTQAEFYSYLREPVQELMPLKAASMLRYFNVAVEIPINQLISQSGAVYVLGNVAGTVTENQGVQVGGTECDLLHITIDDDGGEKVILPLFTGVPAVVTAVIRNPEWAGLNVLEVDGASLVENKAHDVNLMADPWMPNELQ